MPISEGLSPLEEQRHILKGEPKDDVVKVDIISSPKEAIETTRFRNGVALIPKPTDDPQDPLVSPDLCNPPLAFIS